ncbi:MAG TPA: hypothetical protein VJT69_01820 [Pyrinomonadaceae bacterium]|nr:hypothetical protein [Pyrinomonadaceae bacterium]
MKPGYFLQKSLSLLMLSLLVSSMAAAQLKNGSGGNVAEPSSLSVDQQDAFELLKTLARNLKSEPDKLTAATLQAQIADVLWQFDIAFAREVFRWSFEAATRPVPDELSESARAVYLARQASSIRQVLTRIGTHDRNQAEVLLKSLQEEKGLTSTSVRRDNVRSELLMQIALELTATNPEQALQLGLHSLSGTQIPPDFGRLLFALSNVNKNLGDRLFRGALTTLRRNDFVYDSALISLVNYLFSSNGSPNPDATVADAQLLANYIVDATWRQPRAAGGSSLPETSAMFYSLVQVRGLPIVSRYASERFPELQGQMHEMASGLTAAQMQRTTLLQTTQQQQTTIAGRNSYDIDEQIERATKEKDPDVRDSLLNSAAHALMREDGERALKVAAMIDAIEVRREAENDIYLALVQKLMRAGSNDEVRKITRKFDRPELQAKVLIELTNRALSNRDTSLATELLSEAFDATSKGETSPDKAILLLNIAQQFARFDTIRGFEVLGGALKLINQLKPEEAPVRSVVAKPRPLRIKTYTVLNGNEFSASDRATLESINFSQLGSFVAHDYIQTRLLCNNFEQPLWRTKFLTAVASAMLLTPQTRRASSLTSSN